MTAWTPSRRRLLQAGAALGFAGVAGCFDAGSPDANSSDALGDVPKAASVVGYADVDALRSDDAIRTTLNDYLQAAADAAETVPATVEDVLDTATDAVGLDPRTLSSVTAFGSYDADGPTGVVARADWTTADVRRALEGNDARVESATYRETDLLLGEGVAVGVLSDGTFTVADRSTVETVIDVVAGDAPSIDGPARRGFEAAADGAIRVAAVPPTDIGEGPTASTFEPGALDSITHAYGAYVIDGDERHASVTVETDDAEAATSIHSDLEDARSAVLTTFEERQVDMPVVDQLATDLAAVDVAADGTAVVVESDDGTVLPTLPLALFSSFLLGLGTRPPQPATPAVNFNFEYMSDSATLMITHVGGDTVRASAISVRGENLETGAWHELGGEASGAIDGDPAVVSGNAVTLDADPNYHARVVWVNEDVSTTLAEVWGPAA